MIAKIDTLILWQLGIGMSGMIDIYMLIHIGFASFPAYRLVDAWWSVTK